VSKRHQANRRRSYGRRQHEIHERQDRRTGHVRHELDWSDPFDAPRPDPLAFMDPRGPRLRFDFAD
jgi:hypothetical protein